MASMSLQAAYDQARQWLESNDLNRAIGLAQYILEHNPDNLDAYRILGEAYLANRQLDRAQEAFERVLRSDPENIPAHVGLGITFERQGRLDRAIPEFEQALEIKPDMPELRSQLLRLYTEAWGSEHAHLRLSRAGLARLYAKGHMLPQAINEFRQVVATQPERFDAMVAMAEALWRDGQEDAAIALCRQILAKQPASLKANLILGYLEMAGGQPEGEHAWATARRMDPYQIVARAVFDTLPPENSEEPTIEEWDEAAWHQRRADEQQDRVAATRPMESVTPVGTSVDHANGSRFIPPPPPPARSAPVAQSDDFLANLLAINTPPPLPPSPPEEDLDFDLDLDMAPFSLDDLSAPSSPPQAAQPSITTPLELPAEEDDEPAMTPFSLADLGLSDDEIAGLESLNEAPDVPSANVGTQAKEDDEPTMTPFSLADLGLSDDEIASLDLPTAATGSSAPAERSGARMPPAEDADEPALTPFSLSDLGLSDDEIAGLDSLGMPDNAMPQRPPLSRAAAPIPPSQSQIGEESIDDMSDLPIDLQPFSLDELDLNSDEPTTGGLGSSLQPFSFDEQPPQRPRVSGFVSDDSYESSNDDAESPSESGGFSWQQPTQKPQPGFLKSLREDPEPQEGSIFSKLRQRHDQEGYVPPPPPPPPPISEDEHLGLFSMDNISLRDDDASATAATTPEPAAEASHAQPLEVDNLQEAVDSGLVQPFSLADLGLSAEEIAALGLDDTAAPDTTAAAAPQAAQPETNAARGSAYALDDLEPIEFETAEPAASTQPSESDDGLPVTGELQPFSLTDLGLSDEEIAALGLDSQSESEMSIGSELGITEEDLEGLGLGDAWDQPQMTPAPSIPEPPAPAETAMLATSGDLLVDRLMALGREQGFVDISDIIAAFDNPEEHAERIEAIGRQLHEAKIEIHDGDEVIDMDAEYAEDEEPHAHSEQERPATLAQDEEPVMTPFSLSDLGLSDEEIAALGLEEDAAEPAPAAPTPAADEEPVMTPFSLSDLGLSDEEIAALGLGETPAPEPATAEAPATPEPAPPAPAADDEPIMTPFSLSDLGLSDEEIAALGLGETPAPEPATAEAPATPEPAADDEPIMTPFSLSDLGLSDEEIAALGLGETSAPEPATAEAPATPEPAADDEPIMTPFSLSELGLSDEEIAALGLGETSAPEPATAEAPATPEPAPPAADDEPIMTPFSLSELGLSDEEIASLGLGETSAPEPATAEAPATPEPAPPAPAPAADDEPVMTPFSLSELGLSDEEIASLGLGETSAPEPATAEAPATPEPAPPAPETATVEAPAAAPEPPAAPVAVVAAPVRPIAPSPSVAPPPPVTRSTPAQPAPSSNAALDTYVSRLEADPQNHMLRLSVARAGGQLGMPEFAIQQYRYLLKHNALLELIVDDVQDLIADIDDRQLQKRLHRTLGDIYTKQGRIAEAMDEYTWTPAGS